MGNFKETEKTKENLEEMNRKIMTGMKINRINIDLVTIISKNMRRHWTVESNRLFREVRL